MSVELTQEVSARLTSDLYGWLTTVARSGQDAAKFGLTEAIAAYSTRLKITPTRVWTTPTG
ncbi:hypothetical protein [Mycobacterium tuberculosis]|uniref:hypothetical protein n=1 Tax=Mycobacterium tuberculosis TaxID=1773 RepID=UPI000ADAFA6F|nr:hypothetical protein [Mycobacterium tuberculosis]